MSTKGASNRFGNARHGRQGHITSHTGFAWAKGFNKVSLAKHVEEHMRSLGLTSATDYVAHAVAFANHIDRKNHVSYVRRKTGQTVKFSKKTGELVDPYDLKDGLVDPTTVEHEDLVPPKFGRESEQYLDVGEDKEMVYDIKMVFD